MVRQRKNQTLYWSGVRKKQKENLNFFKGEKCINGYHCRSKNTENIKFRENEVRMTRNGRKINAPDYLHDIELYTDNCWLLQTEEPQNVEDDVKILDWRSAIENEQDSHK